MVMEVSPKQGSFPFRRLQDRGLLGCFMPGPRLKRQAPSSPESPSSSSSKEDFFSSDDADRLFTTPNSTSSKSTHLTKSVRMAVDTEATESSFVFSTLPASSDAALESPSFRTLSDPLLSTFSYTGSSLGGCRDIDACETGSSFGGRKPVWLPLPPPACETRLNSGSGVSTSSVQDENGVGSWSIRRKKSASSVVGLPLPPPSVATKLLPGLESFEFGDLVEGTREFAPESCMEMDAFGAVYRAWVKGACAGKLGREMAVVRLNVNEFQTLKDWRRDVQMLAQLPDANICLIKGYCAHEDVDVHSAKVMSERLLVFEQSPNGTLHDYLCGSRSKTQLDWSARISIVLGAARGLMYLHDRGPLQIVYREFKGCSVLLDKEYTPRLAGYGLVVLTSPPDRTSSLSMVMKTSQAYARRNVWSFGIVLVELLTGKYSQDPTFLCNERTFVRWARPHLTDQSKLSQILDPRLKGQCPLKGANKVAELAVQCLKKKAVRRPSMSRVVETLKCIKADFGSNMISRRATFGGLSFRDLEDRQFSRSSSVSTSSDDEDSRLVSRFVPHFCSCAVLPGKPVEHAKANSCRVS